MSEYKQQSFTRVLEYCIEYQQEVCLFSGLIRCIRLQLGPLPKKVRLNQKMFFLSCIFRPQVTLTRLPKEETITSFIYHRYSTVQYFSLTRVFYKLTGCNQLPTGTEMRNSKKKSVLFQDKEKDTKMVRLLCCSVKHAISNCYEFLGSICKYIYVPHFILVKIKKNIIVFRKVSKIQCFCSLFFTT